MRLLMMYKGWHLFACYSSIQLLRFPSMTSCRHVRTTEGLFSRTDHSQSPTNIESEFWSYECLNVGQKLMRQAAYQVQILLNLSLSDLDFSPELKGMTSSESSWDQKLCSCSRTKRHGHSERPPIAIKFWSIINLDFVCSDFKFVFFRLSIDSSLRKLNFNTVIFNFWMTSHRQNILWRKYRISWLSV